MVQERGWIYSLELTYDELNRRNETTPGWIDINAFLDIYAKAILKVTQVPQEELECLKAKQHEWTPFHVDIPNPVPNSDNVCITKEWSIDG